jgi:hypothetical protein
VGAKSFMVVPLMKRISKEIVHEWRSVSILARLQPTKEVMEVGMTMPCSSGSISEVIPRHLLIA